ncbi:S8 family serine peptidase [Kribbella antibiotica]|uniref:S8 family serine peptidase n=1 Tax=Kribbella antibiotica TaxID=190195 RepID=UPI001EE043FB|nr:S8 family serine peptidase [Kribbella antibiotica]
MVSQARIRPAIAVLAVAGFVLTGVSEPAVAASAAEPKTFGSKDVQVTLITGDRVVWRGGDPDKQAVEPGPGREGISFQVQRTMDHSAVIPSDALDAVAAGRLDERLFDVTGLIEAGYDDASSKVIPVLAADVGKAKRVVPAGAKVTRRLSSINGVAIEVEKSRATSFLAGVSGKIWLDGKRRVTLDQSVPQIGGPAAWAAGYTGKGVSVAVLDTGVDATHPDLAPQVAGAKNFTAEPADDLNGHGTHVASTIAGTGAASGGKYKGVAPDAKIYDGKVCGAEGCYDSDLLAGMEWAAKEVKAQVINLSVGGTDTPELDPIEEAVNRLTAETGTLFVIAAGNSGTVESPGSADAALTVGAVDKLDSLAYFSGTGPRVGDSAVKPDVTAPGVDIVAAKARNSSIGDPVGEHYLRLTGTSMATPHTAGAVALLAQEHPSWTAGELKSALMGSAKVAADQTSFDQGAGRIDLTTAIKQSVVAETASLSFGLATFPHTDDEPVVKTLTYRNLGDQPITLNLATTYTDSTGAAAPAGALALSANTVTVPAGGTASVQAISNTNHAGPEGLYSGRIAATGGGQTVVVPVGVDKEITMLTLTVKAIGRDGEPARYPVSLFNLVRGSVRHVRLDAEGSAKVKLAKGEYLLDQVQQFHRGPEDSAFVKLVEPSIQLDGDRTVVLDARKAQLMQTTLPTAGAVQAVAGIGFSRTLRGSNVTVGSESFVLGDAEYYTFSSGPKLPEAEMFGYTTSQWGVPGADGFFTNTPYLYGLAQRFPGEFPTGPKRVVRSQELAVVDTQVNKTTDRTAIAMMFATLPGLRTSLAYGVPLETPRSLRYYLDVGAGWTATAEEATTDEIFPRWQVRGPLKHYRAGRTYREQRTAAAFGPSVNSAYREADQLFVSVGNYGDAAGFDGFALTDSASTTLTRDGVEVGTSEDFGFVRAAGLPVEKATYKLVTTGKQSVSPFATTVDLTATFSSGAVTSLTDLPISTVRFQPKVDAQNFATRTKVTALPVVVDGAKAGQVRALTVDVSGDDGKTWTVAKVRRTGHGFFAVFKTPAGSGVSLRAVITDKAGNQTTQSVVNSYRIR